MKTTKNTKPTSGITKPMPNNQDNGKKLVNGLQNCLECREDEKNQEISCLEQWTGMRLGYIIFDTDVDNWNRFTSIFDKKTMNKSDVIVLIEDKDGNLFGGYINAVIESYDRIGRYVQDPKSFLFSLKSNGRLEGITKFSSNEPTNAFFLGGPSDGYLLAFGAGNDIGIYKESKKHESYCRQTNSFNYDGIENALSGIPLPDRFTPIRITVIQLI